MQFIVPQFIDVEDKILGPFSVRQFIILIAGAGLVFASYKLLDFYSFLAAVVFISVMTLALAFLRVNGSPFHLFLINLLQTLRKPRMRIWRKMVNTEDLTLPVAAPLPQRELTKKSPLTASRLAQLSLIVDTGGVYHDEESLDNQT